jgi:uncharacterized protein YecT (DUF1311 family)
MSHRFCNHYSLTMILFCTSTATLAADVQRSEPNGQAHTAVLGELSQRSGLPEAELNSLLADCNANQQSIYFCAWRDQIAADKAFGRALSDKQQKNLQCKTSMETKVANWKKSRDLSCEKSATQEWGEGSMKPTAQAICVTVETVRMTKRLEHMKECEFKSHE